MLGFSCDYTRSVINRLVDLDDLRPDLVLATTLNVLMGHERIGIVLVVAHGHHIGVMTMGALAVSRDEVKALIHSDFG